MDKCYSALVHKSVWNALKIKKCICLYKPYFYFNSSSYFFKFRNVIAILKAFLYLIMNGAQLNS